MDLFLEKNIRPMLIGADSEPFDSEEHIYELKLDGERCLAYLDLNSTELINKRAVKMLPKVPELREIHKYVTKRCILDGELTVIKNGKPDFSAIQCRSLMSHRLKIELAAQREPACFTAFDILYVDDHPTNDLPLLARKSLLQDVVARESSDFAVSRYIENNGIAFYELAKNQGLEGIVAKVKDSKYYFDRRTQDWIKIKNFLDDDFVVCGYLPKENNMMSLILGQYDKSRLTYIGHVTLGVRGESFKKIKQVPEMDLPPFTTPPGNEGTIWLQPKLVCTVKFMQRTANGGIRQPVFKGLREDKQPEECIIKSKELQSF